MTDLRTVPVELLRQALEALESGPAAHMKWATDALRAALEQPEQAEPTDLCWAEAPKRTQWGAGMMEGLVALGKDHTLRLYAEREALPLVVPALRAALAQPEQALVDPTPAMIEAGAQRLVSWEDGSVWPDSWDALQVAAARNDAERVWRSMSAALKQPSPVFQDHSIPLGRRTQEQPIQPTAWLTDRQTMYFNKEDARRDCDGFILPLYAHPPRREWRGLTEEEREAAIKWAMDLDNTQFSRTVARAIEAALKEKNHG